MNEVTKGRLKRVAIDAAIFWVFFAAFYLWRTHHRKPPATFEEFRQRFNAEIKKESTLWTCADCFVDYGSDPAIHKDCEFLFAIPLPPDQKYRVWGLKNVDAQCLCEVAGLGTLQPNQAWLVEWNGKQWKRRFNRPRNLDHLEYLLISKKTVRDEPPQAR